MQELDANRFVVAVGGYFPRLEVLKNGDLLAAVKSGAAHVGKSGRADTVRSRDGGMTWSKPVTVFDLPGRDDAIDLLGSLSDGTVIAATVSYTWAGPLSRTQHPTPSDSPHVPGMLTCRHASLRCGLSVGYRAAHR